MKRQLLVDMVVDMVVVGASTVLVCSDIQLDDVVVMEVSINDVV